VNKTTSKKRAATKTSRAKKASNASGVKKETGARTKKVSSGSASALIIVESPTKARTLGKYLNSFKNSSSASSIDSQGIDLPQSFNIIASGGHVRDLPKREIGINIEKGFKPKYVTLPDKTRIVNELKKATASAQAIYIATDPDREGEAIAWHISNLITTKTDKNIWRITFHEITKRAVQEALKSPSVIDQQKVDAQQARRIMDRLVGYQVSPLLWKTVTGGLSAGRVQSVALRLICEREAEILAFIKEEYWTIDGEFKGEKVDPFLARLHKLDSKKVKIPDETESNRISKRLETASYRITDIQRSRKKRNPAPPYITSTMQQDAGRRLGLSVKRTMGIAQKLYEGVELGSKGSVGLITYMRTDSTRVAAEANTELRDWIATEYGPDFLCKKPRIFRNKKGAVQDAHEAIRPTDIKNTPKAIKSFLSPQEYMLYELIWKRFVATQMRSAEIDVTTVTIGDGKGIEFRASGQVIVFSGFLVIFDDYKSKSKDKENEENGVLPKGLITGMLLDLDKLLPKQHFTQPPPRFTEAGLVKFLDELGIGRPSTYAAIISTLLDRKYIERQEKVLPPTELGQTVNSILVDRFPDIFNVDFTAHMEEELDRIETGATWLKVVEDFYSPFSDALKIAQDNYLELKKKLVVQPVGKECPKCGKDLVFRWGRKGKFISCSGFPKCKYAENINAIEPVEVEQKCPKCDGPMVLREGRYGRFLGCKNYPKCRGILPLLTGYKCPEEGCSGELAERRSKKGKTFYSCNHYPDCKFITWDEPADSPCPHAVQ